MDFLNLKPHINFGPVTGLPIDLDRIRTLTTNPTSVARPNLSWLTWTHHKAIDGTIRLPELVVEGSFAFVMSGVIFFGLVLVVSVIEKAHDLVQTWRGGGRHKRLRLPSERAQSRVHLVEWQEATKALALSVALLVGCISFGACVLNCHAPLFGAHGATSFELGNKVVTVTATMPELEYCEVLGRLANAGHFVQDDRRR